MSMKRKKERFHLRDFKTMFASKLDISQFVKSLTAVGQDFQELKFSLVVLVDFLVTKGLIDRAELTTFVEAAIKEQQEKAKAATEKIMAQESIPQADGTCEVVNREATPEEVEALSSSEKPSDTVIPERLSVTA